MKNKTLRAITFIILSVLIFSLCACTEQEKEPEYEYVLQCAKKLHNMMKDPDSFSVYGTCGYYKEDGSNGWEIVVLPYRAKNSFGGYITEIAYFVEGDYVGDKSDYTSGAYKKWDWTVTLVFEVARNARVKNLYSKTYDPEKIMNDIKK